MGLSVVYGIVKNHGGGITVLSEPGKGTTFAIYLPAIMEEEIEIIPSNHESTPVHCGSEHILFVDDEQSLAEIGKKILERLGYKVTTRTSSIEALECFRKRPLKFDVLITDMTMPNLTGLQLAREIKKIRPGFPIIMCTGYGSGIDKKKCREFGISGLVMKPVLKEDLCKAIRKALKK